MCETKPLRIAHVMPGPYVGGVEHATLRLASVLDPTLCESVAFCLSGSPPVEDLFRRAGFRTVPYDPPIPALRPGNFIAYWKASRRLASLLRREGIEAVHCADLQAGWCTALAARFAGIPAICHIRNRFDHVSGRDQFTLRMLDRFAFVSRSSWDCFGMKVPLQKGTVIYDGFDPPVLDTALARREVREEFGIAPGQKIVGMSARIAAQKDHETLVRAAPMILAAHPDTCFLMVGDHSSADSYRDHYAGIVRLLEELGIRDKFIFTGYRGDAVRLTAAMQVFVLSTHFEGLPLVLLEAMSLARPTVATAVDGIPEVITDAETGWLVPARDPETLAKRVIFFLDDPARADAIGQRGRIEVESRFNNRQFRESMHALYRDLTGRGIENMRADRVDP